MVPSEERKPSARQAGSAVEEVTAMTYAGIEVADTDSAMAAADAMDAFEDEVEEVECPECYGACSIYDLSPDAGWIDIACPSCDGYGTIPAWDGDEWDDPEPPAWAAPALALVAPPTAAR